MRVHNVHVRELPASVNEVGALINSLGGPDDRLWPHEAWPPMRLDRPLGVGATGGHGPIRYHVVEYTPSRSVRFAFTAPAGFDGWHEFTAHAQGTGAELRHTLSMQTHGPAWLSWPLIFRHLHDALIEDALDRAEFAVCGTTGAPASWSVYVRLLRRLLAPLQPTVAA